MAEVELGKQYRDPVSGWKGTAVSIHLFMYGCRRVTLEGADKDGKPESFTFDEPQLVAVPGPAKVDLSEKPAKTGGPRGTVREPRR